MKYAPKIEHQRSTVIDAVENVLRDEEVDAFGR